jgi:uncharacterized protein YndB with AHSA1/START domain
VSTARRSRTIAASVEELWAIIYDPHHLPRWWPRVTRVEGVEQATFTEVMKTKQGRSVRADFDVTRCDERERVLIWNQRVEGTPFAHVLRYAETELRLTPAGAEGVPGAAAGSARASVVTIELRQELVGFSPRLGRISGSARFGGLMARRAAGATLEQALAALERISV